MDKIYRNRPEFSESATDIFNALAAEALMEMCKPTRNVIPDQAEPSVRVTENVQKAEQHVRMNEYSWIIRGFLELQQGLI